jgi:hypothetical protein
LVAQVLQDRSNGRRSQKDSTDAAADSVAPIDPLAPLPKDRLLLERA